MKHTLIITSENTLSDYKELKMRLTTSEMEEDCIGQNLI